MKDALAETLLAHVLGWGAAEVASERPRLQALASYKLDEYQQFSPGMRFVESLARWLHQFQSAEQRYAAYRFVMDRLLFFSAAEMSHLVESAYPDHVRPYIIRRAAATLRTPPRLVGRVVGSAEFRVEQRRCLFLGLSDGARIDIFRRANRELSHEQIVHTHELAPSRVKDCLDELGNDLGKMSHQGPKPWLFRTIVLLDDFSASGSSYYALKTSEGKPPAGKIAKFYRRLTDWHDPLSRLVEFDDLEVVILLYVATEGARDYLRARSAQVWGRPCHVEIVQTIPASCRVARGSDAAMDTLIETYYDHSVFDESMKKGGTEDARYGYAGNALPVVLHHNAPNNSIFLLWAYENLSVRGLFPRVQRHKEV